MASSSASLAAWAFVMIALIMMHTGPSDARHILQSAWARAQAAAGQGSWAPLVYGNPGSSGTPGTPGAPGAPGTPAGAGGWPSMSPIVPFSPFPQWPTPPTPAPTAQPPATTPTANPAPAPAPAPTPAPSTPSGGTSVNDPVLQGVLDQHNMYRARHHVPPLSWSTSLQATAQSWANGCSFSHSNSGNGENIAWGFSTFSAAVDAWYNEVSQYNFANGGFSSATGHFTQMVWKSTTMLGCAYASCSQPFYVCEYSPPGNYAGQFQQNVFPA